MYSQKIVIHWKVCHKSTLVFREPGFLEYPLQFVGLRDSVDAWVLVCDTIFFFIYFRESLWIEYTVPRTDVTCVMWPSSDQSNLLDPETSICYIRTDIGSTRALFYVLHL